MQISNQLKSGTSVLKIIIVVFAFTGLLFPPTTSFGHMEDGGKNEPHNERPAIRTEVKLLSIAIPEEWAEIAESEVIVHYLIDQDHHPAAEFQNTGEIDVATTDSDKISNNFSEVYDDFLGFYKTDYIDKVIYNHVGCSPNDPINVRLLMVESDELTPLQSASLSWGATLVGTSYPIIGLIIDHAGDVIEIVKLQTDPTRGEMGKGLFKIIPEDIKRNSIAQWFKVGDALIQLQFSVYDTSVLDCDYPFNESKYKMIPTIFDSEHSETSKVSPGDIVEYELKIEPQSGIEEKFFLNVGFDLDQVNVEEILSSINLENCNNHIGRTTGVTWVECDESFMGIEDAILKLKLKIKEDLDTAVFKNTSIVSENFFYYDIWKDDVPKSESGKNRFATSSVVIINPCDDVKLDLPSLDLSGEFLLGLIPFAFGDDPCNGNIEIIDKKAMIISDSLLGDEPFVSFNYDLQFVNGSKVKDGFLSIIWNIDEKGGIFDTRETIFKVGAYPGKEIQATIDGIGIPKNGFDWGHHLGDRGYYLGDGDEIKISIPHLSINKKNAEFQTTNGATRADITVSYDISWFDKPYDSSHFPETWKHNTPIIKIMESDENPEPQFIKGVYNSQKNNYDFTVRDMFVEHEYRIGLYLTNDFLNIDETKLNFVPNSELEIRTGKDLSQNILIDKAYVDYFNRAPWCHAYMIWHLTNADTGEQLPEGKYVGIQYIGRDSDHIEYLRVDKDGNLNLNWGCMPGSPKAGGAKIATHTLENVLPWSVAASEAYVYDGDGNPLFVEWNIPDFWQENLPWDVPVAKIDECHTSYTDIRQGQAEWIFTLNDGTPVPEGTLVKIQVNDKGIEWIEIGENGKLIYPAHAPNGYKHTYKLSPYSFPYANMLFYGPAPPITMEFEGASSHIEPQSCP
jgi:hypothetical protein